MKKIRYILSLALASCILSSCVKEAGVDPVVSKLTGKLRISVGKLKAPAASLTSKSSASVSGMEGLSVTFEAPANMTRQGELTVVQETQISDLLVVQVLPKYQYYDYGDIESVQIIGKPQYFTSGHPDFPLSYDGEEYTVNFEYSDIRSELLCIANLGDPDLFEAGAHYDYNKFVEKLFITYDSEADVTKDEKIVMLGMANVEYGLPDVELIRVISKIQLTVDYSQFYLTGGTLKINSIQLCNVPKMSSLLGISYETDYFWYNNVFPPVTGYYREYEKPRFDQLYPHDNASELFINYNVEDNISSESIFVWYMPEHLRGNNLDIWNAREKYRATDPSYLETDNYQPGAGISYSTNIEIKGVYTDSESESQNVRFTIYLGDDDSYNHYNFDIYRNYFYNITVTIKSIDINDNRIVLSPLPS